MGKSKDKLVATLRSFGGEDLRDAWLFDEETHESLFVREDVGRRVTKVDVAGYLDNERYGYVTRRTFEELHYTEYNYTVRAFDAFTQFRTFIPGGDEPVGLIASFDPGENYDFDELADSLDGVTWAGDTLQVAEARG